MHCYYPLQRLGVPNFSSIKDPAIADLAVVQTHAASSRPYATPPRQMSAENMQHVPLPFAYLMANRQHTCAVLLSTAMLADLDLHLVCNSMGIGQDPALAQGLDDEACGCALGLRQHLPGLRERGPAVKQQAGGASPHLSNFAEELMGSSMKC